MKNTTLMITLLFLTLISSTSFAQDSNEYYIGMGIGSSQFNLNKNNLIEEYSDLGATSSFGDNSTSFNFFGGWSLDRYLDIEADFISTGDITAKDGNREVKLFDVTTLAISTVLSKQINENARIFGKIGVHFWDISESSGNLDTINNAIDLTYGLGADLNLYGDKSRQLRLQWNRYEYDGVFIDSNDTISASLLFHFGDNY